MQYNQENQAWQMERVFQAWVESATVEDRENVVTAAE